MYYNKNNNDYTYYNIFEINSYYILYYYKFVHLYNFSAVGILFCKKKVYIYIAYIR